MTDTTATFINRQHSLKKLQWDEISEPGAYVEVSTGNLYRITQESLVQGAAEILRESRGPASPLVLVSKDPYIFALAARMICVDQNIHPNF